MNGLKKNSELMIILPIWREYITTKALWYSKIPDDMKHDPNFHEDLAQRINEIIARILSEPPSEEQIATIQMMQESSTRIMSMLVKQKQYTSKHC